MAEAVEQRYAPFARGDSLIGDAGLGSCVGERLRIRLGGCKSLTVGLLFAGNEAEAVVRLPRLRWCGRKAVE
jgi:hypothetical protein